MLKSIGYISLTVLLLVVIIGGWLSIGMGNTPEQTTVTQTIKIN